MDNSNSNTEGNLDVSEIDRMIAQAKANKAKRGEASASKPAKAPKAEKAATEAKRPRLTDEEKAARDAARAAERATRKQARATARDEKRALKAASKQPAHMRKVQKAAEKLTALEQAAMLLFNEATASLTAAQLSALALHIQHFNRVKATERALAQTIEVGTPVTIVGGDPRFIGKTGTVSKVQRIRCYVTVEGGKKDVYLFTSDVARTEATEVPAVASA